jgi:FlaA1/EpsC-like NDP-sugar epimerase
VTAFVHLVALLSRRVYFVNARYLGLYDAVVISLCGIPAALTLGLGQHYVGFTKHTATSLLVTVLYLFLSTTALLLLRLANRSSIQRARNSAANVSSARRILVVGAGDAGEAIVREITLRHRGRFTALGLVDDDDSKRHMRIHGVPVIGKTDDIPRLVEEYEIDEVILAIPVANGGQIRRIHNLCREVGAPVRTLPALSNIFEPNNSLTSQLREVQIEDLLRRDPVTTEMDQIEEYVSGENILITGGGGSIGQELARQVARLNPASLILVGKGENSLYEIQQELLQTTSIAPNVVVADVRDKAAMAAVFQEYRPTVVFHAAAHKHVPLMQKNLREAIRNNVLGTLNTAELAVKYGAAKFILISTDKAVRPSSVMGATKRVCEMIVSAMGQATETEFATVRFGNVLGSRGSLVPLLTAQIKRGGPVTVTHSEMTRYFMTIPEAVQLVLQAGAMGQRGEIFILDMGEPVKIDELARELIRLHGLVPDEDIAVKYTGIRPGEKIHEELVYNEADLKPTSHPKIRVVSQREPVDLSALRRTVDNLVEVAEFESPEQARQLLMQVSWQKGGVPVYDSYLG